MKRLLSIGILLLCLAVACNRQVSEPAEGPSPELTAIDSLMWHQPDSALAVLIDYLSDEKDTACHVSTNETFDNHYAQLLASELLYKNDYVQTNRTELRQAVAYFDSLLVVTDGADTRGAFAQNIAFFTARAHYINGVGYYERDSVVEACAEYLKALETMEGHFEEQELVSQKAKFMALTYNRLGDMFSEQFMMEPSIYCYKKSCAFSKISPISSYSISSSLYRIGKQFAKKYDFDSANYYYSQAIANMPDSTTLLYRDIISNKSLLSYQLTHQSETSIRRLKQMVALAKDEGERLTRYLIIGGIYFEERRYDSAQPYLKAVFENMDNVALQVQAAEYLRILSDSLDKKEQSDYYIHFIAMNKPMEYETDARISNLSDLFKNYLEEKQRQQSEKEKHEERKQAIKKTIGVIIPISMVVALTLVILVKLKGRKRIEAERQSHHIKQAALSSRLKRSNQKVRELEDRIIREDDRANKAEPATSFIEDPVCRLIMERVNVGQFKSQMDCTLYKDYALGKEQIVALRETTDCHFGQFTTRLKKAYPDLTHSDLDYCCLYLLGLTDADISALMQKAYPTVSQRSRKIKAILGSDSPLSVTLTSIAHNNL